MLGLRRRMTPLALLLLLVQMTSANRVPISQMPDLQYHLQRVRAFGQSLLEFGVPDEVIRPPIVTKADFPDMQLQFDESLDVLRPKRAAGCDPGWTGVHCESPICYNFTQNILKHDGTEKLGDLVEADFSLQCTDTLTFYIDNFVNDFFVTIQMPNGGTPSGQVINPQGVVIDPCYTYQSDNQTVIHQYCESRSTHGAGVYRVTLKSESPGLCTLHVNGPTSLTIDGGFVEDPRDDDAQVFYPGPNEAIHKNPNEYTPAYLVFHQSQSSYPVQTTTLHIFNNARWDSQYNLTLRYSCAFHLMTNNTFNCMSLNTYYIKVIGFDDGGNIWQRIYSFVCNASPFTEAPITGTGTMGTRATPPPETKCDNGGTLYNGSCYCGEFFEGFQCDRPVCLNGGSMNVASLKCVCAQGYSGDHCQHIQCSHHSGQIFDTSSAALGFVIRSSQSMQAQQDTIVDIAINISSYYEVYFPNYLQSYVLTIVQNNGALFTREFDNSIDWVASMQSIIHPPTDTICDDALLQGVSEMLDTPSMRKYMYSQVFVFSDGTANDDQLTQTYLLEQLTDTRAQLFFMMSDSVTGRCNVDVTDPNYAVMRNMAKYSRGLAVQTKLEEMGMAAFNLAMYLWQADTLLANDLDDCRKVPTFQPFFIDESVDRVIFQATGSNLTPQITMPNQTVITPALQFQVGNLYIWVTEKPPVGGYLLNFTTGNSKQTFCNYRVLGRSLFRLYYGMTNSFTSDLDLKNPIFRKDSHFVAHVNGVWLADPIDTTIETTIWYNDPATSERQVMYASSGQWRDGCDYEMYFGSITCQRPGLIFYINVYVTDSEGLVVLRTTTGYCSPQNPVPPNSDCFNGGVIFNGTCVCPDHFSGPKCQSIFCEHNGVVNLGICQCPPGFAGQFCEIPACTDYNPYVRNDTTHRSLTFLLHDSLMMRSAFRTLNDISARVVNDITYQHPMWITHYQLITFDNATRNSIVDTDNASSFVDGFNQAYQNNLKKSSASCKELDVFGSIYAALTDPGFSWGGIIYVFLYGSPKQDLTSWANIIQHVEITKAQINFVQTALSPCGADITEDGLMTLAQFSGGTYFVASAPNAGNVFRQLPLTYSSGIVYEDTMSDCSDYTFYVPVDDGAQSFTAYISGDLNKDPIYTPPNGKAVYVAPIFNDPGTMSRMDLLIRPCDAGWSQTGQNCWKFVFTPMSWTDAQNMCHGEGATLATIFNQQEQNDLNFPSGKVEYWTGLNDLETQGTWVWDNLPNSPKLTLDQTQYKNWQPNEPSVTADKRCVSDAMFNGTLKGWKTSNCGETKTFVCMKHAYGTDYQSDDPNKNHLQRGIWKIRVQVNGGCSILVRTQSTIQIQTGYTTNIHSDMVNYEPTRYVETNRLVARVTGLDPSWQKGIEYVHFYFDNMTISEVHTTQYRSSCTYNFVSTPFSCPTFNWQMLITGVDGGGYLYQRVVPVACLGGIDENSCENGGVWNQGVCICPPNFGGSKCEVAICRNGGRLSGSLTSCVCNGDFIGTFCEYPVCTRNKGMAPLPAEDGRSFIVAWDGTNNGDMSSVNQNVSNILIDVIKNTNSSYPTWFSNFVGVVFRDSASQSKGIASVSDVINSTDFTDFANKMQAEITSHAYTSSGSQRDIFSGLIAVLKHPAAAIRSQAFVVTNGYAEDTVTEADVLDAFATSHTTVNMLVIGDDGPPGGGNATSDNVQSMFEASHVSGGQLYQFPANGLSANWRFILSTLHYNYYMISHHLNNCSSYVDYLQFESNGTEAIIDLYTGSAPEIDIIDTNGNQVFSANILHSKTNTLEVFMQQSPEMPGIWTVNLDKNNSNPGMCLFNARGLSDVKVYVAFTQDTAADGGWHDAGGQLYPDGLFRENAVVAATNAKVLTYAQIYDMEERRLAWASPMILRWNCAYAYISTSTFRCERGSFILGIDGLDWEGHPFRRMFTMHCENFYQPSREPFTGTFPPYTGTRHITTTVAPTDKYPSCDILTPNIDVIVVFDSSYSFPETEWHDTVGAFRDLAFSVTFGPQNVRMQIGTYDSAAYFEETTLDSLVNTTIFFRRLQLLQADGYTGGTGNNLQAIFNYLISENSTVSFRTSPTRKMIVVISSIGWNRGNYYNGIEHGYPNPHDSIATLLAAGVEFVPIAFGPDANIEQLSVMSSDCLQRANTAADISYIVNHYLKGLFCRPTPTCGKNTA